VDVFKTIQLKIKTKLNNGVKPTLPIHNLQRPHPTQKMTSKQRYKR